MSDNELRYAVLIDADNAPQRSLGGIMQEIAVYGTPTIKRIYGDWTTPNLAGWKKILLQHAVTPVQQYGYTTGKNATDSAMIIDAMDILYSGRVDGFCLVSSDSDFTRLATRLREAGMKVIGMGEKKTPEPFIVACDKFIYIEVLMKSADVGKSKKSVAANAKDAPVKAPVSQAVPDAIIDFISATIEDVADDDGWAYLGEIGNLLVRKKPDFDARNYGFKKLTQLFESLGCFEVDIRHNAQRSGKLIYVRLKRP
ncbi:MAG: NYN domain-containing protein [Oscillospiraceae bacterium]|nr:NYN domain-containing protein [Oscillospiraceae bacterium]